MTGVGGRGVGIGVGTRVVVVAGVGGGNVPKIVQPPHSSPGQHSALWPRKCAVKRAANATQRCLFVPGTNGAEAGDVARRRDAGGRVVPVDAGLQRGRRAALFARNVDAVAQVHEHARSRSADLCVEEIAILAAGLTALRRAAAAATAARVESAVRQRATGACRCRHCRRLGG